MLKSDSTPGLVGGRGPTGAIRRAHLSMQRCADAIFRPRRITTDQYSLLLTVHRHGGIRQTDLADELFTDSNTVTAMLMRLEKRGLVQREVCSDDRRARRVRLTPSGRRLTEDLASDWEPMRRKLRESFTGHAGQEALRILDDVCRLMMQTREAYLEKPVIAKNGARGHRR